MWTHWQYKRKLLSLLPVSPKNAYIGAPCSALSQVEGEIALNEPETRSREDCVFACLLVLLVVFLHTDNFATRSSHKPAGMSDVHNTLNED